MQNRIAMAVFTIARRFSSDPPPPDDLAQQEGFAKLLRACSNAKDLDRARRAHEELSRSEQHGSRFLNNLVIDMYGKCGSVREAKMVFDRIAFPNSFSWNIMMAAYIQNGHLHEACHMFLNSPHRDVVSWTTMVAAYAQNGHLPEARQIFDKMPGRNLVSWNAMIAGYVQNAQDSEAVLLFHRMDQEGAFPNRFTLASILDAYGNLGDVSRGKFTHGRAVRLGDIWDAVVQTALIIMYGKFGEVESAELVFGEAPQDDVVILSSMMAAYAQNGHLHQAENVFESAPSRDVVLWTGMLTAYAQNGNLAKARETFSRMPEKNAVSWSAIIAANAQHGQGKEAVMHFKFMDQAGEFPNQFTIGSLIDACSAEPTLSEAKLINSVIKDNGFKLDVVLSSALINMYGKCGCLELASEVFETMRVRNVVTWNTMIATYAESGHGSEALYIFSRMHLEGIVADELTVGSALAACSHSGLLEDARVFFELGQELGNKPTLDNYSCMIHLLGKAGRLNEAEELINCMPYLPRETAWVTLLSCCQTHNDVERAARVGHQVLKCGPDNAGPYVLLSNVYS